MQEEANHYFLKQHSPKYPPALPIAKKGRNESGFKNNQQLGIERLLKWSQSSNNVIFDYLFESEVPRMKINSTSLVAI